ncbi:hypothetical protein SEA_PARADIDDLES_187 [Streptomyces phage Paradiddles]|uniref:Uncharacterized protein n=3 Tax=Samistivirus TaxID=2560220 RepID=A0A514U245_9CAUD|nr:hypothetical protein FDI36_gp104 [Streptomyces phage NootNoot]YP_009611142.1 hypothetical protein FDI37_gp103 [Streptomyces phage Paradiddles]YP_010104049.1 hypothetical protein KNU71_gp107 [Streptomyces phage Braelyn]UGL63156.1 hypothetical protein SEA_BARTHOLOMUNE_194 [Streptomyces phage Bartholomune]UOW93590.1 hypothetical protein SEA_SQUILLIUM_196 [Streptomyces phage Squillium]WNM73042.1 hypothetical protein SEA_PERSIMMON_195 [Streptomyces phage Persimmon]WNM73419.1 hypothetical protei
MKLYFVSIVLVDEQRREYSFSMTIPATSREAAKAAVIGIGMEINEATGHKLKVSNESHATDTGRTI